MPPSQDRTDIELSQRHQKDWITAEAWLKRRLDLSMASHKLVARRRGKEEHDREVKLVCLKTRQRRYEWTTGASMYPSIATIWYSIPSSQHMPWRQRRHGLKSSDWVTMPTLIPLPFGVAFACLDDHVRIPRGARVEIAANEGSTGCDLV
jgi:hypothetical protein